MYHTRPQTRQHIIYKYADCTQFWSISPASSVFLRFYKIRDLNSECANNFFDRSVELTLHSPHIHINIMTWLLHPVKCDAMTNNITLHLLKPSCVQAGKYCTILKRFNHERVYFILLPRPVHAFIDLFFFFYLKTRLQTQKWYE